LCSQADPGEVVIDQITCGRLGALIGREPLQPLKLKGQADPLPAYHLLEVRSLPGDG
jgi:hypothetical protein